MSAGDQLNSELDAIRATVADAADTITAQGIALAALSKRVAALEAKPVEPPPGSGTVPPKPPTLTVRKVAPDLNTRRGYGSTNPLDLSNIHLEGYEQGIVVDPKLPGYVKGKRAWRNVRTVRSLRNDKAENFGQGAYLEGPGDNYEVSEYYADECGWWSGCGASKNDRTWGVYTSLVKGDSQGVYFDGEYLILIGCGAGGLKLMDSSSVRKVIGIDLAWNISTVYGSHKLYEGTFYRPSATVVTGNPTDLNGGCGLYLMAPVECRDLYFVGHGVPKNPTARPGPLWCAGLAKCDNWHTQYNANEGYPSVPGGKIDAKDCVYAGWPGEGKDGAGPIWTGAVPHDGSGFTAKRVEGAYDPDPVRQALKTNQVSIPEAYRMLRDGIRGLVK